MAERVPPIRSQSLLPVFLMLGTGCELLAGLTEDRRMRPPEDNLGGTRSDGGRGGSTAGADTGGTGAVAGTSAGAAGSAGEPPLDPGAAGGGAGGQGIAGTAGSEPGGQAGLGGAGPEPWPGEGGWAGAGGGDVSGGRSCEGLRGTECNGESCCTALPVPEGTVAMGRSDDGNDAFPGGSGVEQPEHAVFVSAFVLDKYEVTVGRFRRFLQAYDGTPPRANAGANPRVRGSGWQSTWNSALPAERAALATSVKCESSYQTWTDVRTRNDLLPINCVSFPVAFAFCIWDGGRLPSEVEWELAASGGDRNRLYPWGAAAPTEELAVFDCNGAGSPGSCAPNDVRPVGSRPNGNGRFGHADLAGSMMELTRDTFSPVFYGNASASDDNAINLERDAEVTAQAPARGGNLLNSGAQVRAQVRSNPNRSSRFYGVGMRCARDP